MKIVITGISTVMGRSVAERLLGRGHTVYGIDIRPWPNAPKEIEIVHNDIRKKPAEELFRTKLPDAVIHMASVAHFSQNYAQRYRTNLESTRTVFLYCRTYGVKQALFVGRHTVYGADPDASLYRTEQDPPLGGLTFPELNDLITADLYSASALWRYQDITTTLLRIVYTLGPSRRGTLANFLKGPGVPTVLGFDPLFQFMHEDDAITAIVTGLESKLHGIYNVAGPQPVPLSAIVDKTGRIAIPIPEPWYPKVLGRFGFPKLFAGSTNHIKYSVVVDDKAFREATGFMHKYDEIQTMKSFRYRM